MLFSFVSNWCAWNHMDNHPIREIFSFAQCRSQMENETLDRRVLRSAACRLRWAADSWVHGPVNPNFGSGGHLIFKVQTTAPCAKISSSLSSRASIPCLPEFDQNRRRMCSDCSCRKTSSNACHTFIRKSVENATFMQQMPLRNDTEALRYPPLGKIRYLSQIEGGLSKHVIRIAFSRWWGDYIP